MVTNFVDQWTSQFVMSDSDRDSEIASYTEEHDVEHGEEVATWKQADEEKEDSDVDGSEYEEAIADPEVDVRPAASSSSEAEDTDSNHIQENKNLHKENDSLPSSAYQTSIVAQRAAQSRFSERLSLGEPVLEDSFPTGADTLTTKSRNIYEKVRFKIFISFIYGAIFLLTLGFSASAGGTATGYLYKQRYLEVPGAPSTIFQYIWEAQYDLTLEQVSLLKRGYGFSCFCYVIAMILSLIAAIRISPFYCGAIGEAHIVTQFQEWGRRPPNGKYERVIMKSAVPSNV